MSDNGTERTSAVEGVSFYRFPTISDGRGILSVGEFGFAFPFRPKRFFSIYDLPASARRGEHAHRVCEEIMICQQGSVSVIVDDGVSRDEIMLDKPDVGLYLPPTVWRIHHKHSADCILFVLASSHYDETDYIRSYDAFLAQRRAARGLPEQR